ncbi:MAG: MurR/RpiR family transcriptional regulator [Oscillospiraceae bacterium]|nr:MurR/RpiR family transcriptional regulator [Oscillospiraceae bacterium]
MNSQVTERIKRKMATFSKGQKRIAQYILEHSDKVAFMTASKLGTTVGVSESTVVRFATEIGYAGYPELQKAVQEMIRNKMTSLQRLEMAANLHDPGHVLDNVLNHDIEVIRQTLEETCRHSFYRAAEAISEARKVYIIGARSSQALATFLSYYLNFIVENLVTINVTSTDEILEQMIRIDQNDAVIGISFPRYSTKVIKALDFASSRGAKVVAITDSAVSPLSESADYLLLARSDMASFVDTLVAPLSLINALIIAVAIKKKDEVADLFEKLEDIWDAYGVYEKVEDRSN